MNSIALYAPDMPKDSIQIPPERVEVGRRLCAARERAGLTQDAVAKHFDLNKATVSAWEKGRGAPDVYRLKDLCSLYAATAEVLLYGGADAWPFERVDQALYDQLTELERGQVQTHMQDEVKAILSERSKDPRRA